MLALPVGAVTATNIVGWGAGITNTGTFPDYGQASAPIGLSNVIAVAAGAYHSVAIKRDGTVVAWGDGQIEKTNVPGGLNNVTAVATWDHTLALRSNGTVIAWGNNAYGRTNVPVGLSNVVSVGVGSLHSLAVKIDGAVAAWGAGTADWATGSVHRGQSIVPAALTNAVAVDGGVCHSLALRTDGTVVAWGAGKTYSAVFPDYGQSTVPAGLNGVAAISAGGYHNLALRSNGTVVAWGYNNTGQTNVPGGLSNVVAISAGVFHSLALKNDGTVVAWGFAIYNPHIVPLGLTNVVAISAGEGHSLALIQAFSPTIVVQPNSQTALEGDTVNLSITVGGTAPFTYQWRKDGTNLTNGGHVTGAATPSLHLSNVTINETGYYTALVSNSIGSVTSAPAVIDVRRLLYFGDGQLIVSNQATFLRSATIQLLTSFPSGWIFYTTDGSDPATSGFLYDGPFTLTHSATIRAIAYSSDFSQSYSGPPLEVTVLAAYVLTAYTAGGGTVSVSPTNALIISNTLASLAANPLPGWTFLEWRGDAVGNNPNANIVINRDKVVEAVFGTTVTLNTVGNGSMYRDPASTAYPYGAKLKLTPIPGANSYFVSWGGALSGNATPSSLQVTNTSPSITAAFATLTPGFYTLTVITDGYGKVNVSPYTNRFSAGQQTVLSAIADNGQQFLGWSGDTNVTQNPLTIIINNNTTIGAQFTKKPMLRIDPPIDGWNKDLFRFTIAGGWGTAYTVQASSNLLNWEVLGSVTNTLGTIKFNDTNASIHPRRYYRAD